MSLSLVPTFTDDQLLQTIASRVTSAPHFPRSMSATASLGPEGNANQMCRDDLSKAYSHGSKLHEVYDDA